MTPLPATSAIETKATVAFTEPKRSVECTMISTGPTMPSVMWSENQNRVVPSWRGCAPALAQRVGEEQQHRRAAGDAEPVSEDPTPR